jgi:hypothetical protein
MLKRLGASAFCARLDDHDAIKSALLRLLEEPHDPVTVEQLAPYDRAHIARAFVDALEEVVGWRARSN